MAKTFLKYGNRQQDSVSSHGF